VLRATVDANILISDLLYSRGKSFRLLRHALEGEISLTVSQPIIDEAVDVLSRKFGAPEEFIAEAKMIISEAARIVRPAGATGRSEGRPV